MPCRCAVAVIFLFARLALAAPGDCVRDAPDGELDCVEPAVINDDRVALCYEGAAFPLFTGYQTGCNWNNLTQADIVAKVNCFHDAVTGCPGGTAAVFPGWSAVGATSSGSWCANITTRRQNGVLLDEWATLTRAATRRDASNNCTVTGQNFSPAVFARSLRQLVCPPGYSTGTRPNGDVKCSRCPANSSPVAGGCVCNPGYVKDPRTRQCVQIQCTVNSDCANYNAFCAGGAYCNNGLCEQGLPPMCDDRKVCTQDQCSNVTNSCNYRFDPLLCECKSNPLPPVTLTLGGGGPIDLSANCGLLPGVMGVRVDWGGMGELQQPTCDNGCQGKASAEGFIEATGGACTKTYTVRATANVTANDRYCPTCDVSTCEAGCGDLACRDRKFKGSASITLTDFVGFQRNMSWSPPGSWVSSVNNFSVVAKCGGSITGTVAPTLSTQNVSRQSTCIGCAPDCSTVTVGGNIGGGAQVGCEVAVNAGTLAKSGAEAVGYATVTGIFEHKEQSGMCGSNSCSSIRGDVEVGARAKVSLAFGWWRVGGQCTIKGTVCHETNSCGTCSCPGCADADGEASCKVTVGGKL